jgi:hypothetical protein
MNWVIFSTGKRGASMERISRKNHVCGVKKPIASISIYYQKGGINNGIRKS